MRAPQRWYFGSVFPFVFPDSRRSDGQALPSGFRAGQPVPLDHALAENELVPRPMPPPQISKPASMFSIHHDGLQVRAPRDLRGKIPAPLGPSGEPLVDERFDIGGVAQRLELADPVGVVFLLDIEQVVP